VQNAQQATELVERQAIELIELIRLEEKKLWVQEERVDQIQLTAKKERKHVRRQQQWWRERIWSENEGAHDFVVVGSKDDMLLDKLNMRNINWIVQKIVTWLAKKLGQCVDLTSK
jgi:hypothetical protein